MMPAPVQPQRMLQAADTSAGATLQGVVLAGAGPRIEPDPPGLHILLVDDERLSRVVVANLLRKCNYQVTIAESGTQAIELLKGQPSQTFHLVLTDVMMPQVDGLELLRYVRLNHAGLPVVMMSASEQAEMVCECIRGGAQEYLVKPVTQKEIQKIWTHVVPRSSGGAAAIPLTRAPTAVLPVAPLPVAGPARPHLPARQQPESATPPDEVSSGQSPVPDTSTMPRITAATHPVPMNGDVRRAAAAGQPQQHAVRDAGNGKSGMRQGTPGRMAAGTPQLSVLSRICKPAHHGVRGTHPGVHLDAALQKELSQALLIDFLRLMASRKAAEAAVLEASTAALDADIALLERALAARRGTASRRATGPPSGGARPGDHTSPPNSTAHDPRLSHQTGSSGQRKGARDVAVTAAEGSVVNPSANCANGTVAADGADDPFATALQLARERWSRMPTASQAALQALYLSRWPMPQLPPPTRRASPAPATVPGLVSLPQRRSQDPPQLPQQPAAGPTPMEGVDCSGVSGAAPLAPLTGARPAARVGPIDTLPPHVATFCDDLRGFARHSTLRHRATLHHGDALNSSQMVCCVALDREDEFFATAGVSKRIRVYELSGVVRGGSVTGAFPVLELSSRSRLSSVCWSTYIRSHLAAADYEGVVALWDVSTNTELMQFEEHAKRVWAVDLNQQDPTRLASASDDGTVRVWAINQEASVATIPCQANVCSVQWNPERGHLLALGAANCRASVYDTRNLSRPLASMATHSKAVSYVRHSGASTLLTASTDNTVRRWDLSQALGITPGGTAAAAAAAPPQPPCVTVYQGHVNERNFVGLSVSPDGYVACGSEDNSVVCYYETLPLPALKHHFSQSTAEQPGGRDQTAQSGGPLGFVSSVCWAQHSGVLLAANSVGVVRVLELA